MTDATVKRMAMLDAFYAAIPEKFGSVLSSGTRASVAASYPLSDADKMWLRGIEAAVAVCPADKRTERAATAFCPTCGGEFDLCEWESESACPECETPKPRHMTDATERAREFLQAEYDRENRSRLVHGSSLWEQMALRAIEAALASLTDEKPEVVRTASVDEIWQAAMNAEGVDPDSHSRRMAATGPSWGDGVSHTARIDAAARRAIEAALAAAQAETTRLRQLIAEVLAHPTTPVCNCADPACLSNRLRAAIST